MKKLGIGIMMVLLGMGMAFAIQPAQSWTQISSGFYNSSPAANLTTQGGNVTAANIAGNVSTAKWAGFYGNVSAGIVLTPGGLTNIFYKWAWDPATNGGRLCVTPGTAFDWTTVAVAAAADIDTVWTFTGTDSAVNTLNDTCGSMTVASTDVSGAPATYTGSPADAFQTCAIADSATPGTKADFAFCNVIVSSTDFKGETSNYELIVPTDKTPGNLETYYAWLELD
jgi:hypothetical protein